MFLSNVENTVLITSKSEMSKVINNNAIAKIKNRPTGKTRRARGW